ARTVAEHLVDTLAQAGVQRIYGVVGDSLNPVTDAIRRSGKLKWVDVRHEETAAFAAGAEAQLTGNLAVCAGSCGVAQYQLPVKVVVFNNHRLGMVQLEQEAAGLPHYGVELKNPNFAALAQAVGVLGLRVEGPEEVRPALERALASSGPVLVDVVTDPNVLSMPPKATVKQAAGFALAMTRMAFTGELEDVIDTVMANWRNL